MTAEQVSARCDALGKELTRAWQKAREVRELADVTAVELQQWTLLAWALENPSVEAFDFSAEYEYDDEGGYYWSLNISDGLDDTEDTWDLYDQLRDAGTSEETTPEAFESADRFTGSITVARLREILEAK
jgi:hypothetical protein